MTMLCLRATPIANNLPSPSELLNGRQYQTNLPTAGVRTDGDTSDKLFERQLQQKLYHDQSARELPPLIKEEPVRMLCDGKWEPARVVSQAEAPRSYNVETPAGGVYRRNRRHLRQTIDKVAQQQCVMPPNTDEQQQAMPEAHEFPPPPVPSCEPTITAPRRSTRERMEPKRFEDYVVSK